MGGHTYEVRFSDLTTIDSMATFYTQRNPGASQSYLAIHADGTLDWAGLTSAGQYTDLLDGGLHSLAVTWDASSGDIAFYVDGEYAESVSVAPQAGSTGGPTFVLGQHIDFATGTFDSSEAFSGTLHDFRVWDHARSESEISLNHQHKFAAANLPTGLMANWQMDGFNGSNQVIDIVTESTTQNRLSIGHATGAGFAASTPVEDLHVNENAANGTSIGYVVPTDPDLRNDIVSDGSFTHAGATGYVNVGTGQTIGGVDGSWVVDYGDVDLEGGWADSPLGGTALGLDGSVPGAISQSLSTEIGREYQVVFAFTGNFQGGNVADELRVSAAGMSQDFGVTQPAGWTTSNLLWEHRSFTFTADDTTTILQFASLSDSGGPRPRYQRCADRGSPASGQHDPEQRSDAVLRRGDRQVLSSSH